MDPTNAQSVNYTYTSGFQKAWWLLLPHPNQPATTKKTTSAHPSHPRAHRVAKPSGTSAIARQCGSSRASCAAQPLPLRGSRSLRLLRHGARGAAAVHGERGARHVVGGVGRQEQDGAHKVLGLRQALERDAVQDVLHLLLGAQHLGGEGRVGRAGQHAVDVDAVRRPGQRQRLGQRHQRALGGAVRRLGAVAVLAGNGGHDDHLAVL
mmetsp:Transcript_12921/g.31675  ORF Transcript_12921/g.31675 Transcript_12921/m.31675 type:complete len:208 (+) Transcript_12921:492-1115(+)